MYGNVFFSIGSFIHYKTLVGKSPRLCLRFIASYEYRISGLVLKRVHTQGSGIYIDSKLRFHEHITVAAGEVGGLINELLQSTVCRHGSVRIIFVQMLGRIF